MADKAFGVKQLNIIGSGTPTIESPGDLSLKAGTVAISTNLYVGGITTHIGLTTTTNDLYVGLGILFMEMVVKYIKHHGVMMAFLIILVIIR